MNCFLDKDRKCESGCMSHYFGDGPDAEPSCRVLLAASALLEIGDAVSTFLTNVKKASVTKHPQSAPPPEVNT